MMKHYWGTVIKQPPSFRKLFYSPFIIRAKCCKIAVIYPASIAILLTTLFLPRFNRGDYICQMIAQSFNI